jgi:hypothetical protein
MVQRLLHEYDNSLRGPKMSAAQREKVIEILMHPEEPLGQQEGEK